MEIEEDNDEEAKPGDEEEDRDDGDDDDVQEDEDKEDDEGEIEIQFGTRGRTAAGVAGADVTLTVPDFMRMINSEQQAKKQQIISAKRII